MQKQSFQRFPLRYRPYDFPARFPVLAFLGETGRYPWTPRHICISITAWKSGTVSGETGGCF